MNTEHQHSRDSEIQSTTHKMTDEERLQQNDGLRMQRSTPQSPQPHKPKPKARGFASAMMKATSSIPTKPIPDTRESIPRNISSYEDEEMIWPCVWNEKEKKWEISPSAALP